MCWDPEEHKRPLADDLVAKFPGKAHQHSDSNEYSTYGLELAHLIGGEQLQHHQI